MKVYVVKYWMTKGIVEKTGELVEDGTVFRADSRFTDFYHQNQFFFNREDAVKRVEYLRGRRIKVLQDQIKKIQEMKF